MAVKPVATKWLDEAQTELEKQGLAGWLIYDFKGSNPVAGRFLGLQDSLMSRRVFLFVPAEGTPTLLVSAIDRGSLPKLPYQIRSYSSRQSLESELKALLPADKVALEYSPLNDIPHISHVDAGTVELVRSSGAEPVSSANLLQIFSAWSKRQLKMHLEAAEHVSKAKDLAFEYISFRAHTKGEVREAEVQSVITDYFDAKNLIYDHPPIVGFGAHSGDPHYSPNADSDTALEPGDVVLIDLWAKLNTTEAPYADITWMGCYERPTPKVREVFETVRDARNLAFKTIQKAYQEGRYPQGCEIDRVTRDFVIGKGYGPAFNHRTGHSIGTRSAHGDAAHLDDFETHDTRELSPGIGVTIEPGVYLSNFGVRSEVNVYLDEKGPRLTTRAQRDLLILPLAKPD